MAALFPGTVAQTANRPRDRALLRRGLPPNPTHGVLCQCRNRGPHHTPFSRDSTWNGKPAPSTYLHRQLDVTRSLPHRLRAQKTLSTERAVGPKWELLTGIGGQLAVC